MDFVHAPQIGEILEQGKQTTANAVKSGVSDAVSSVQGQIGIKNEQGLSGQAQSQNQLGQLGEPNIAFQNNSLENELTEQMVKDFYAPSDPTKAPKPQTQEEFETAQKLVKLRQELHTETYYNPLFAYENKKQETPAEIAKQEEQQKMIELEQKKEDKKLPLAVQRAQTSVEVNRGASG